MASPAITKSRSREARDHGLVARRVARGEGEPHAAVAEQVEGARRRWRRRRFGRVEVDGPVVEHVVVVLGPVAAQQRAESVVAASHSGAVTTNDGVGELRDPRGVVEVQMGHHDQSGAPRRRCPRSRSWAGTSRPAPSAGREARRRARPCCALGFAATEGCRPVSTSIGPAPGWRIRKAGQGTRPPISERGAPIPEPSSVSSRPPGRSKKPGGSSTSPPSSGSTTTVAPGLPPAQRRASAASALRGPSSAGQRTGPDGAGHACDADG